jgi:hypothetical protein
VSAGISERLAGAESRPDSRHKTDFYDPATQLLGELRDLAALGQQSVCFSQLADDLLRVCLPCRCPPAAARLAGGVRGHERAGSLRVLQDLDRWRMRYKLGAEHLEQVRPWPSPRWVFRLARSAPVGPTHAVDAATCGIAADRLEVPDEDWEAACFVEKCPQCFAAVVAHG